MVEDEPLVDLTLTAGGKEAVQEVASAIDGMLAGPLEVHIHVLRQRRAGDFGTGNSEGLLKESADAYPNMRLGVYRGLAVMHGCDGIVWEHGAVSALLVTCAFASMNAIKIVVRQAPVANVGDMIRHDLPDAPLMGWTRH